MARLKDPQDLAEHGVPPLPTVIKKAWRGYRANWPAQRAGRMGEPGGPLVTYDPLTLEILWNRPRQWPGSVPIGTEWPIVLFLACLAGVVGLLAAREGRGRAGGPMVDAVATGVLVGLLVGMVPRLTGSATVVLARLLPGLQPELRSQVGNIGPVIIQNLAAALVIGVYLVSMWFQRRRRAPHAEHLQPARVFAVALWVYALANGMATGSSSLPLALSAELIGGVVLAHICRGLALGGASSGAFLWLVAAAVLGGPLGVLGSTLARGLGFATASLLAVPVLVGAVGLVVLLIARLVGPGLGSGLRRLPVTGFLAGLGLTLLSARLIGPNF